MQGPQGPRGSVGESGVDGEPGDQGPQGEDVSIIAGNNKRASLQETNGKSYEAF